MLQHVFLLSFGRLAAAALTIFMVHGLIVRIVACRKVHSLACDEAAY